MPRRMTAISSGCAGYRHLRSSAICASVPPWPSSSHAYTALRAAPRSMASKSRYLIVHHPPPLPGRRWILPPVPWRTPPRYPVQTWRIQFTGSALSWNSDNWEHTGVSGARPCPTCDGDAKVPVVAVSNGGELREWRRSRGWDVPELARRLRRAADEPIAAHDGLVRMISAWERGDHRPSERYELLYRGLGLPPGNENGADPRPAPTRRQEGTEPVRGAPSSS